MKHLSIIIALVAISCSPPQKEEVLSPAGANSEEPAFFTTKDGNMGLSWLEKKDTSAILKFSVYKNSNWLASKTLVSGKGVLTNWADFPGIQTNGKHWVAWFLQMSNPDTFAYDVMVMQSSDEGETWTAPQRLHSDSTLTEHGFVSAVPATNGFQLMWLDGRSATEDSPIFTVRSAHLNFEGNISNRIILDDNTCTCCQTTMLNTGNDNFIALYRDRTEEEIRDIAGVKFNNEGVLVEPKIIFADEWHIPGCPVNGPRAVMNGNKIGVAWFTMTKEGVARVKFATSKDKGKTYFNPILIDENNLGRVDLLADDGTYYLSFMDNTEKGAELRIIKIEGNRLIDYYTIAQVSPSRKTGFPRMALAENGEGIYVTYVDVDKKQVAMKYLAL
ncbi:MAG: exo-alpha-sialidase [Cyclobacteriaceae bacterium]|nr:exo-alpha-sialidase [Cyclobacteriaceae bacterium]